MSVDKSQITNFIKERGGFAMIPNELWQVEGLEPSAIVLWCYIYSQPSDWSSSRNNLARNLKMSNNTVSMHIGKLVDLNMLSVKNGARGSWSFQILPPRVWTAEHTGSKTAPVLNSTSAEIDPDKQLTGSKTDSVLDQKLTHIQDSILLRQDYVVEAAVDSTTPLKSRELLEYWNAKACGRLKKIKAITSKRLKHLKARFTEQEFVANWQQIIDIVIATPFLRGDEKDWVADFDWIIKNDSNYVKVLEGKYGNKKVDVTDGDVEWI